MGQFAHTHPAVKQLQIYCGELCKNIFPGNKMIIVPEFDIRGLRFMNGALRQKNAETILPGYSIGSGL